MSDHVEGQDFNVVEIGKYFSLSDFFEVIFEKKKIKIHEDVYREIGEMRQRLDELIKKGEIIYGVNTGFGALANKIISSDDLEKLQLNVLRSHAVGVGEYAFDEVARGALLLRIISFTKGNSGIRPQLLKLLELFFNSEAVPLIPIEGSVGASGDLAPLSHLALTVIGDPSAYMIYKNKVYTGKELKDILKNEIYKSVYESEEFSDIFYKNENLEDAPLIKLSYKEGLALNNGTAYSASTLAYATYSLEKLIELSDLALALSLSALSGLLDPFDERLYPGDCISNEKCITAIDIHGILQVEEGENENGLVHLSGEEIKLGDLIKNIEIENNVLKIILNNEILIEKGLVGSIGNLARKIRSLMGATGAEVKVMANEIHIKKLEKEKMEETTERIKALKFKYREIGIVQDAYSLRCSPHVHGAARKALNFAKQILEEEINTPNDNPLIFKTGEEINVISGGNFHGQSIALAADTLAMGIAYIANISERRIFRMLDPNLNRGLPPFLAINSGLNSGLMIAQYLAANLVAEIRALATPHSVQSIPTSANQEDIVSMSASAVNRLLKMIDNLEYILAIEILTALQGIALRLGLHENPEKLNKLNETIKNIYTFTNNLLEENGGLPIINDRVFRLDIEKIKSNLYEIHGKVF
ncbi:MAG: HAL/PAL/TAL family ammonia-lyase [Candidatus Njordarchaeia archaeon]